MVQSTNTVKKTWGHSKFTEILLKTKELANYVKLNPNNLSEAAVSQIVMGLKCLLEIKEKLIMSYIILKHLIWRLQIYNLFHEIFKFKSGHYSWKYEQCLCVFDASLIAHL